jgi:hypothetical protein
MREGLVRKLRETVPALPWRERLETACREIAMIARRGSPAVPVTPQLPQGETNLIVPVCPQGETTTIAADGGSGKTTLAVVLGLVALNGATLPGGIRATRRIRAVLFCDYETTKETVDELACLIGRAQGWDATGLYYKAMTAPLVAQISAVKADISKHDAELVIIDSAAPASGIDPEGANAAVAFHTALRSLGPGVTRLVTAHVNATTAAQPRGIGRPFGSVFNMNLPRSVWELRRSNEDADDLQLALYHRKVNRGRLHPPISLTFAFEPDRLIICGAHLGEAPDLLARAPLPQQLRAALSTGAKTIPALAVELDAKEDTIDKTLRRLRDRGVTVQLPGDKPPYLWGLKSR